MKKLTLSVLVVGLFAGSLLASENNKMMNMSKEDCMTMHKSMHQDKGVKALTTFEKHQDILNNYGIPTL